MIHQTSIDIVTSADPQLVSQLIELQQKAFPPQMQDQDPERYYREALSDKRNLNVILRSPQGSLRGYLLGMPQPVVVEELRQWDPQMHGDPSAVYVDIIQVHPDCRGNGGFLRLVTGLCREAGRRGHQRLNMHVRTRYGLHLAVRRMFPDSRSLRRIENWWGSGESFEYIEASPTLRQRTKDTSGLTDI